MSNVLLIETADRIRALTLNRPDARNALSRELSGRLFAALAEADTDNHVDVVILTGTDPAFCAGLDLKEMSSGRIDSEKSAALTKPGWPHMTKPVIGAINGFAVTGGLELALSCDILIASKRAVFADTHTRVGILPGWGMSVRLPQQVGTGMARRMSLTGDYLSADDALRYGLVTQVVAHDDLLSTARRIAASIVGNNQAAVRALLGSYHRIDDALNRDGWQIEHAVAKEWLSSDAGVVAANHDAVIARGRSQTR